MAEERHAAVILLESLLDGIPVEIGGQTYALSEDYRLCTKGTKFSTENPEGEEVWLNTWAEIPHLIKIAESMTKEERVGMVGNLVLNQIRRK